MWASTIYIVYEKQPFCFFLTRTQFTVIVFFTARSSIKWHYKCWHLQAGLGLQDPRDEPPPGEYNPAQPLSGWRRPRNKSWGPDVRGLVWASPDLWFVGQSVCQCVRVGGWWARTFLTWQYQYECIIHNLMSQPCASQALLTTTRNFK